MWSSVQCQNQSGASLELQVDSGSQRIVSRQRTLDRVANDDAGDEHVDQRRDAGVRAVEVALRIAPARSAACGADSTHRTGLSDDFGAGALPFGS